MTSSLLISKFNNALGHLFDVNAWLYDYWIDTLFDEDGYWIDEEVTESNLNRIEKDVMMNLQA